MSTTETSSELAEHLADLLDIQEDIRCNKYWDTYPKGFIGPIQHIDNCNCRIFWILEMTTRILRSVIQDYVSNRIAAKSVTFDSNDIGRFTGRWKSFADSNKGMEVGKLMPPTITGRIVDRGPELQDPRGLDIEKVEHNKHFDIDFGEIEQRVLAKLANRDMAMFKNFYDLYGPSFKEETKED